MEDCCDNKNIIFTDYVCTNCGIIHGYKYIHEISCYENEYNLNKKFIPKKVFYNRMYYLNKKLYWITDRSLLIFLNEGLEKTKNLNNYKRVPFTIYANPIYKYYCEKSNII